MVYEDLTTRRGASIIVLNLQNNPLVVNEKGQTLGGQLFGKVSVSDPVVKRALGTGRLVKAD